MEPALEQVGQRGPAARRVKPAPERAAGEARPGPVEQRGRPAPERVAALTRPGPVGRREQPVAGAAERTRALATVGSRALAELFVGEQAPVGE